MVVHRKLFLGVWSVIFVLLNVNDQLDAAPSRIGNGLRHKLSNKDKQLPINPAAVIKSPLELPITVVTPTQNTTCRIKCPINEICQLQSGKLGEFECICPQELSFFKINSVCREYIGNMSPCHVTRNNDCNLVNNEECLPVDEYTNQGTCQCMTGYQRDQSTFECKSQEYIDKMSIFYDELKRTEYNEARPQKLLERRRPQVAENPKNDNIYAEIIDEMIQENNADYLKNSQFPEEDLSDEVASTEATISPERIIETTISTTTSTTSTATPTTSTATSKPRTTTSTKPTTTTTAESVFTDSPKISTENLRAEAGEDIQVHYPSTSCILNGSLSKVPDGEIIRWMWTKLDRSPAFGKFVESNEGKVVVYENLVQGTYKFVLKIWSSSGDFSQDTVDVYVYSSYTPDATIHNSVQTNKSNDLENIYNNLVEIELDYKPEEFTQLEKENILKRLDILLRQSSFHFIKPKIIVTNTRVSVGRRQSRVVLEFFVCDDIPIEENNQNDLIVFDLKKYFHIEEDLRHYSLVDTEAPTYNQILVNSSKIVSLLKHKSLGRLIDTTIAYIKKLPMNIHKNIEVSHDNLAPKIIEVSLITCRIGNFTVPQTCSDHGVCDHFNGKCSCDKYWMPNLYLFYFRNDKDLTSGNNCEWNIILFTFGLISLFAIIAILLNILIKYILYYFFCCCCCVRSHIRKSRRQTSRKMIELSPMYGKKKKALNHDSDSDYEVDSVYSDSSPEPTNRGRSKKYEKAILKKILQRFKGVPDKNIKYALLEDQEDLDIKKSKLKEKRYAKYEIDDNCDEDVVFDASMNNSAQKSPRVKEYKNLL